MATDWISRWLDYEARTGKRPSQRDPESKNIYYGVRYGVKRGYANYRAFWETHQIRFPGTDWLAEWKDYVARTGKRPSQTDPESSKIYSGVMWGVRTNQPGYREFWAMERVEDIDWIAEWESFEARTGRRPSSSDPESSDIYSSVSTMVWKGYPRYVEFFESRRLRGKSHAH